MLRRSSALRIAWKSPHMRRSFTCANSSRHRLPAAIVGSSRLNAAPLLGFGDRRVNGIEFAVAAALDCDPHVLWRAADELALGERFGPGARE